MADALSKFISGLASIHEIGLIEPIVIYKNMVLDGRNRYDACTNARVKPHYTFFEGDDAAALNYVLAKNMARRHLTTSQRAIVAAKIADMKVGDNQHKKEGASNEATSQSDAAEKLNVSRSAVQRAAKVIDSGDDELIAAVESGEVTVSAAAEVVQLPKEERPKALSERAKAKGPRIVKSNAEKMMSLWDTASDDERAQLRKHINPQKTIVELYRGLTAKQRKDILAQLQSFNS